MSQEKQREQEMVRSFSRVINSGNSRISQETKGTCGAYK